MHSVSFFLKLLSRGWRTFIPRTFDSQTFFLDFFPPLSWKGILFVRLLFPRFLLPSGLSSPVGLLFPGLLFPSWLLFPGLLFPRFLIPGLLFPRGLLFPGGLLFLGGFSFPGGLFFPHFIFTFFFPFFQSILFQQHQFSNSSISKRTRFQKHPFPRAPLMKH